LPDGSALLQANKEQIDKVIEEVSPLISEYLAAEAGDSAATRKVVSSKLTTEGFLSDSIIGNSNLIGNLTKYISANYTEGEDLDAHVRSYRDTLTSIDLFWNSLLL
jgi:hypothetical protein